MHWWTGRRRPLRRAPAARDEGRAGLEEFDRSRRFPAAAGRARARRDVSSSAERDVRDEECRLGPPRALGATARRAALWCRLSVKPSLVDLDRAFDHIGHRVALRCPSSAVMAPVTAWVTLHALEQALARGEDDAATKPGSVQALALPSAVDARELRVFAAEIAGVPTANGTCGNREPEWVRTATCGARIVASQRRGRCRR